MTDAASLGCTFIVGRSRKWDGKTRRWVLVPAHCNKLPAERSEYCPKHQAISREQEPRQPQTYLKGA